MIKEPALFLSWIGAIALLILFWPLGLIAIAALVIFLIKRSSKHRALNNPEAILAELRRQAGVSGEAKFAHVERETGIVLNPGERILAMRLDGLTKVYGYEDVREWEARIGSRQGRTVGYGLSGTVAAGAQNMAAGAREAEETGLFMTMRDIDHPVWRISMADAKTRERWAEILRQEVNERVA